MLYFFFKKKEGRPLSNFYEGTVVLNERVYSSGESAFHGSKYLKAADICDDAKRQEELMAYAKHFEKGELFGHLIGSEVKRRGGKGKSGKCLNSTELAMWQQASVEVQEQICNYKYEHDENVRAALNATVGKVLIHPAMRCSKDKVIHRFWEGRGEIVDDTVVVFGENMLGKIWMRLRDEMLFHKSAK